MFIKSALIKMIYSLQYKHFPLQQQEIANKLRHYKFNNKFEISNQQMQISMSIVIYGVSSKSKTS